jgi:hypothetical protein
VFIALSRAKSLGAKARLLSSLSPKALAPVAPAIAEYTTGMSMGESAEKMAKENDVSRRAQDEVALMSHRDRWAIQHLKGSGVTGRRNRETTRHGILARAEKVVRDGNDL